MLISRDDVPEITIPHEPDQWIGFKPLSWSEKKAAIEARQLRAFAALSGLSADVIKALPQQNKQVEPNPWEELAEMDQGYTLHHSIVAWSYKAEVTPENIDALDAETADWAFEHAVKLCSRSKEEGEESPAALSPTT